MPAQPRPYSWVRISPDGTRIAMEVQEGENSDIWIHDLARHVQTRLTFGTEVGRFPFWTTDGRRIVWSSGSDLVWKAADGTGQVERVATSNTPLFPSAWSQDGRTLLVGRAAPSVDILMLPLEGDRELRALLAGDFSEGRPAMSPDGKWMAYYSNESGRFEIFVRPFPNVDDGRWQISTDGGTSPIWSPDGQELFYRSGDAMMAVPVHREPVFSAGTARLLFRGAYIPDPGGGGRVHDISPDGRGFLMIKEAGERVDTSPRIIIVLNWLEEVKRRVPTN